MAIDPDLDERRLVGSTLLGEGKVNGAGMSLCEADFAGAAVTDKRKKVWSARLQA